MKKIIYIFLALLAVLLFLYVYLKQDYERTPSTLYTNGHIITLNDKQPIAEAMWVEDGLIKAIGTNASIEALKTENILSYDLKGATVMPGFIDAHTHFALSMFLSQMHDLSGFRHETDKELWDYFEDIVGKTPKGDWIIGTGIDPILIKGLVTPTINYLDQIAPENPVLLLSQSLHNYWANSIAFEKAGISKATPDPSLHSYFEKNAAGELTGMIVEQEAVKPFMELLQREVQTTEMLKKAADEVMVNYAKNGNTCIVSAGLTIQDNKPLVLLKHLSDQSPDLLGSLLAKIGMLPKRKARPRHFIYMRHDRVHLLPENKSENDFYNIIGVKHWMDGSPYIGTMYLDQAYLDSELSQEKLHIPKNHRGEALISKAGLKSFLHKYHEKGWQIAVHTQGDAAIREVLDAFEELDQEMDINASRHRLEHCLLLPTLELDRMKALNLSPSFHVNHLYYYGDALKSGLLGEERTKEILPLGDTQKKSHKIFSSCRPAHV